MRKSFRVTLEASGSGSGRLELGACPNKHTGSEGLLHMCTTHQFPGRLPPTIVREVTRSAHLPMCAAP